MNNDGSIQSKYNLEQSTKDSRNRNGRLRIIFLYPSRAIIKPCLLVLLLPWLMANNGCFHPAPSAPPAPPAYYPQKPPSYEEANSQYVDQDLKTEIKVETKTETANRKEPKTKQEAKKYAQNSLKAAEREIKICRKYITDTLPNLETKYLALDKVVRYLKKFCNAINGSIARSWNNSHTDHFNKLLGSYCKKLHKNKTNFESLHCKSIPDHLRHAALYIQKAKDLGSKDEWSRLDNKRAQLESQLENITNEWQEVEKHKTIVEKRKAQVAKTIIEFIEDVNPDLVSRPNMRNENHVIIQNQ